MSTAGLLYGVMAEFDDVPALEAAVERAREAGYTRLEAYTPFPVEGLAESLGSRGTRMPLIVLIGALLGAAGAYAMQYWMMAVDYPLNIGGRPLHSPPPFVPVTFECAVLLGALFGFLGMLALSKLPRPHHPLFNVAAFDRATNDRFFLVIEADDPRFQAASAREFLHRLEPLAVHDVPN